VLTPWHPHPSPQTSGREESDSRPLMKIIIHGSSIYLFLQMIRLVQRTTLEGRNFSGMQRYGKSIIRIQF